MEIGEDLELSKSCRFTMILPVCTKLQLKENLRRLAQNLVTQKELKNSAHLALTGISENIKCN